MCSLELDRNANSQVHPSTTSWKFWGWAPTICFLTSYLGNPGACSILRTTPLVSSFNGFSKKSLIFPFFTSVSIYQGPWLLSLWSQAPQNHTGKRWQRYRAEGELAMWFVGNTREGLWTLTHAHSMTLEWSPNISDWESGTQQVLSKYLLSEGHLSGSVS